MKPVESTVSELRPIDELERSILNLCTRINLATYELLVMIREFEERAGFLKWGLENCAEWLAWRCDLSMTTAREKVRTARALKELPSIAASFSTGELSYAKVRALTRVANRANENELLAFALRHTAVHVAERCRELRMGDASSIDVAERAFANRSLRVRRDAGRAVMTITVDLPLDAGELIEKALDKARDDACLKLPDLVDTSWSKRQADAFVTMLKEYLNGDDGGKGSPDNYLVNIHVDRSALAGNDGRSALPIESVKRLCCDGKAVVLTEDAGQPLSIGRKSRIVPKSVERAVRARDHDRCSFPGCRNRRFLHCHHVEHWSNGGETSLDNLMLLCTKHHTLVHEGGFRIRRNFRDAWTFYRPDGVAVPDCGYFAVDMVDDDLGEPYENPPRGGLLSAVEKLVNEP
ncbi:MAG: HNH endonuclease, partial [Proteobacteria bacterium]|nr:HNH endonuclease [Pseudomonadota bacterium]